MNISAFMKITGFLFRAKVIVPILIAFAALFGWNAMKQKAERVNADQYRTTAVDRGPVQQRITANGTLNPVTVVNVGT
jgi:HlyD family secretion protein